MWGLEVRERRKPDLLGHAVQRLLLLPGLRELSMQGLPDRKTVPHHEGGGYHSCRKRRGRLRHAPAAKFLHRCVAVPQHQSAGWLLAAGGRGQKGIRKLPGLEKRVAGDRTHPVFLLRVLPAAAPSQPLGPSVPQRGFLVARGSLPWATLCGEVMNDGHAPSPFLSFKCCLCHGDGHGDGRLACFTQWCGSFGVITLGVTGEGGVGGGGGITRA